MFHSPWELDVNARYAQRRVAEGVAACRLVPPSEDRAAGSAPALAPVLRLIGRGLIAAGERLAGPTTTPARSVRPAA